MAHRFVQDQRQHAFDDAAPVIRVGSANDVRITGGDLYRDNKAAVEVRGIKQLKFTFGTDSHGGVIGAKANQAVLTSEGAM